MLRKHLPALASGMAVVFTGLADASTVRPPMSVSDWAEHNRVVSAKSGSPRPGPWKSDPAWCREIMDSMGVDHPCRQVTVRGSAQSMKSECALNAILSCIDQDPRPMLVVLPSLDEARKYNEFKFEPNCRESAGVQYKVAPQSKRTDAGDSSTTLRKKFGGGFLQMAAAGTSKPFQMITVGMAVFEEVEEYDDEAGDRGDTLEQARARGFEYGDEFKQIVVSTTGAKAVDGESEGCRTTREFLKGSQEWLHAPCPHCGDYYALTFDRLTDHDGSIGMVCPGCGTLAESHERHGMIGAGVWVACFEHEDPERHPAPPEAIPAADIGKWAERWKLRMEHRSFQVWRGITLSTSWDAIWAKKTEVDAGKSDPKVFCQQWLGEPYEPVTERPEWEPLHEAKGLIYRNGGEVPPFVGLLTGAIDVQVDRLEWAVYGWGRGGVGVRIEKGEVFGETDDPATWGKMQTLIMEREWQGPRFKPARPIRWAVDSGFRTQMVYQFARNMRGWGVRAIKGEDGPKGHLAPEWADSGLKKIKVDGRTVGRVPLALIGIHQLKDRVYFGLQAGAMSGKGPPLPRALLFGPEASEEDFKQLTAEYLKLDDPRYKAGQWLKVAGQANEQLDLAVYNLAAAIGPGGLDRMSDDQWEARYREALPEVPPEAGLAPLEQLWTDPAAAPPKQEASVVRPSRPEGQTDALALAKQQLSKWNRKR